MSENEKRYNKPFFVFSASERKTKCDCSATRFPFFVFRLMLQSPVFVYVLSGLRWTAPCGHNTHAVNCGVLWKIEKDGNSKFYFVPRKQEAFDKRRRHEHRQNQPDFSGKFCLICGWVTNHIHNRNTFSINLQYMYFGSEYC